MVKPLLIAPPMKRTFISTLLCSLSLAPGLQAQSLEDILRPKGSVAVLSSGSADEAWKRVVAAFRANDMVKATEEGNNFLASNFNASAFQVMGVKVMLSLAGGAEMGTTFENRDDQETYKRLLAERATITKSYQEQQNIIRTNEATINEITLNKKRPVQQGSSNYYACAACSLKIGEAQRALEALAGPILKNKTAMEALQKKSNQKLKPMTLQLLDGLLDAGEIEAAIAIVNTYIRVIGNDIDVAQKQQDITRLQEAAGKAAQVIDLMKKEIQPFIDKRLFWEASDRARAFLTKAEAMSPDKDLTRFVKARANLDPLGIERTMMLGERSYNLIRAQAELDTGMAMKEFKTFQLDYPDHPQIKELELYVTSIKVKSAEEMLAKAETEFDGLKKRFDPEKLRATVNRRTSNASRKSSDDILAELGVAPADARMVKISLQGLSARLAVLDKTSLPADRRARLNAIKVEIDALMELVR